MKRRPQVSPSGTGADAGAAGGRAAEERARRERLAYTLRRWRVRHEAVARIAEPSERAAYEWAIALAMRYMPVDGTFGGLLRADGQRGGAVDACVRAACLCGAPDHRLLGGLVRGAAFWRLLLERLP